ncbi:MAG: pyridoxal phosphate-dependent aminotransferase [Gemmatimonadota bacterium]|nr:pyridoxal phosphate-dependent aminotransferase [Gemmatimonadota bacterium]MDH3423415.1 pyridoxal phosphate-dependent aminotransferase [Gemmatimonadota bacterium]
MRFSANIEKLQPSATIAVSTLAKKLAAEGRDILNLSAGEPDFDTPVFIADAAVEGIQAGRTRYTPPAGIPELRAAIAARLSERGEHQASAEGVVVTAGAKQALFNAIFTLFGPGDEVLIAAPYWTTYPTLVELARARPVEVFGDEANGFKVTAAQLDRAATGATRGLVLNTPCNPTGAVYTLDELGEIAAWCKDHDVWLLSDEIYRDIHHDSSSPAPGILSLPESGLGPSVLVDGASKGFAMTGWRIGFSYADPEISKKLTALQSQITSNAATPSQVAALAAFSDVAAAARDQAAMGEAFRRRRDLVCSRMRELLPDVPFVEPAGAFYLYFRVDGLHGDGVDSATEWCSKLLREQGVALVPGGAFGDDAWVRLSFATSDEILEDAFRRIATMVGVGVTG